MTMFNQLNNGSIVKFGVYSNDILEDDCPESIVIAGDGIFYKRSNPALTVFDKTYIPYRNVKIPSMGIETKIFVKIPKPPMVILEQIFNCFKYVNAYNLELTINVYYEISRGDFIVDIPNQIVSDIESNYTYNSEFENSNRFVRYLQIHSHGSMPAFFSSVKDDKDESKKPLSIYGVVGNIKKGSIVNSEFLFRIWTGFRFVELLAEEIFDFDRCIPDKIIDKDRLDFIINNHITDPNLHWDI